MANDKWSGINPWLGLAPYTEGTPLYGRTQESAILSEIIKDNIATIVYGKSGIGKSSLLSAGISPMLRSEQYIPVPLRLVHNTEISYVEQIEARIREIVDCKDELPDNVPNLGLWDFFHRHTFTKDGVSCRPVIILDQFEEIYTLTDVEHKPEIIALFTELASLLNDIKPDAVLKAESSSIEKPVDSSSNDADFSFELSTESSFAYNETVSFRFVICLREDKFYLLERNSANIPSIKTNRYNLQALSPDSAFDVITCPRPELFTTEEATAIVDKLADMGDEGIRTVDPAILSLFLYKYFEKKGEANYDNIFADYYHEATKSIKDKSLAFLEDHLLTLGGYRNQIPVDDALSSGVSEEDIQSLLKNVIIRKEQRKGIDYIEFFHDRLCAEAKKSREERKVREQSRRARKRMLLSLFVFAVSAGMLSIVLWLTFKYQTSEEGRLTAIEQNEIIRKQKLQIEEFQSKYFKDIVIKDNIAGNLYGRLPFREMVNVGKLTISGKLDGTDINWIKQATKASLRVLDLYEAQIVSGGNPYDEAKHVTKNNIIGKDMFVATDLQTIILPSTLKTIEERAFMYCFNLEKLVIPQTVTSIGNYAFCGNNSLIYVDIPTSVTKLEPYLFFDCRHLKSMIIPKGINKIGWYAFGNCESLAEITLSKGLTIIDQFAFSNCKSLRRINSWIDDISQVKIDKVKQKEVHVDGPNIDFLFKIEEIGTYTQFKGIPSDCTWHVLKGKIKEYKSQTWWVPTWNIIDDLVAKPNQ